MKVEQIMDGLYMLPGLVNVYWIKTPDGYALIDSGFPKSADKILQALASCSIAPEQVRHMVITHGHPDHMGSAAALQQATGATVYAHEVDEPIIRTGSGFRVTKAAPGLRNRIMHTMLTLMAKPVEGTAVDCLIADGEGFPFDEDLTAVHIPGHSAGQIALLWKKHGGVLFTADACINRGGMQLTAAIEDLDMTRQSLAKLAGLTFECACFGHGKPILKQADARFREQWHTGKFSA